MVPKGWNLRCLDELARVERGKFSARPRNDPKYYGGSTPFVQTGDISNAGTYLTKYSQTLNCEGVKVSKIFPPNSVLITIAANIGDTAIATFDVACPDSIVVIQAKPNVSNFFWLKMVLEEQKKKLDRASTQNAQKNINLQVLKPLLLLVPPIDEQIKIAKILSTWDRAIDTTEKLVENSKVQKKSLMQQLLTGKKRFPRFNKIWSVSKLSEHCHVCTGSKDVQNKDDNGKYPFFVRSQTIEKINSYSFDGEAVLIPGEGGVGKIFHYINGKFDYHQRVYKLSEFKSVDGLFIYYYMQQFFKREVIKNAVKATVDSLRLPIFTEMKITIPELVEQKAIAQVLKTIDLIINNYEVQHNNLVMQKKALMQQLLTGKRRVKLTNN